MSFLDGLDVEVLEAFGDDFRDGYLIVPSTTRQSDGQGGYTDFVEPAKYPCKVLVLDYSDYRRQQSGIPGNDRRALVLAASLTSGVRPLAGQTLQAYDPFDTLTLRDWQIVARTGDAAGATFSLQVH